MVGFCTAGVATVGRGCVGIKKKVLECVQGGTVVDESVQNGSNTLEQQARNGVRELVHYMKTWFFPLLQKYSLTLKREIVLWK